MSNWPVVSVGHLARLSLSTDPDVKCLGWIGSSGCSPVNIAVETLLFAWLNFVVFEILLRFGLRHVVCTRCPCVAAATREPRIERRTSSFFR